MKFASSTVEIWRVTGSLLITNVIVAIVVAIVVATVVVAIEVAIVVVAIEVAIVVVAIVVASTVILFSLHVLFRKKKHKDQDFLPARSTLYLDLLHRPLALLPGPLLL